MTYRCILSLHPLKVQCYFLTPAPILPTILSENPHTDATPFPYNNFFIMNTFINYRNFLHTKKRLTWFPTSDSYNNMKLLYAFFAIISGAAMICYAEQKITAKMDAQDLVFMDNIQTDSTTRPHYLYGMEFSDDGDKLLIWNRDTSCLSIKTHYRDTTNPYDIALKIQGVYELIPAIDADNPRILVLSPILHITSNTSYLLTIDAVLVQRGQFFDNSSVRQWTALSVKDKTIYYSDGTIFGVFLSDDYSRLWVRDHSTDSDNDITWQSYFTKIKRPHSFISSYTISTLNNFFYP